MHGAGVFGFLQVRACHVFQREEVPDYGEHVDVELTVRHEGAVIGDVEEEVADAGPHEEFPDAVRFGFDYVIPEPG